MEREAEKLREELKKNRILNYLKPIKPTSCPRVACGNVNVARERRPIDGRFTVQVGNTESSTSYDMTESGEVTKERHPHRAVPNSVTTPQSANKGRKRGRIFDFDFESPAKRNILEGKAEDVTYNLLHTCLKDATPPGDAESMNLGSGCHGGQTDNCCETQLEEKVICLT